MTTETVEQVNTRPLRAAAAALGTLFTHIIERTSRFREGPSELAERLGELTRLGQLDWNGDRPYLGAVRRGDLIISDGHVRVVRAVRQAGTLPARITHPNGTTSHYHQAFVTLVFDQGDSVIRAADTLVRRIHVRPSAPHEHEGPSLPQRVARRAARFLRQRNAAFAAQILAPTG